MKQSAILLALLLTGCGASRQEVVAQLGSQYVGQNVDLLVRQFGPPSSTFRLNSGESAYEWQIGAKTSAEMSGGNGYASGTSQTSFCKIRVIAATGGVVTQVSTEDAAGSVRGGLLNISVVNRSFCAEKLGIKPKEG